MNIVGNRHSNSDIKEILKSTIDIFPEDVISEVIS